MLQRTRAGVTGRFGHVAEPVLSAFGTGPVLVGFAAVQRVCMLGVAAASLSARGRIEPARNGLRTLELVGLRRQRGECRLRKSFTAAEPSDHVSMRPKRGAAICVAASPAAAHVPTQRVHVTSSPIA